MEVEVNLVRIQTKFAGMNEDPDLKLMINNALAKELNPYVPMQTGVLSQTPVISAEGVLYTQPYAHYQYTGIVYGPNIPVMENGVITGWFSPAGKGSKYPTGRPINYSPEIHPLATHHWEKAMMRDRGDEFTAEVNKLIGWYLKKKK